MGTRAATRPSGKDSSTQTMMDRFAGCFIIISIPVQCDQASVPVDATNNADFSIVMESPEQPDLLAIVLVVPARFHSIGFQKDWHDVMPE
ncbi:MAG TPA: hypothetical protein VNT79_01280 [Phycisphaerae bacterium]|nr:hypothetical protein [Phycisphaerae bacterium]